MKEKYPTFCPKLLLLYLILPSAAQNETQALVPSAAQNETQALSSSQVEIQANTDPIDAKKPNPQPASHGNIGVLMVTSALAWCVVFGTGYMLGTWVQRFKYQEQLKQTMILKEAKRASRARLSLLPRPSHFLALAPQIGTDAATEKKDDLATEQADVPPE